MIAAFRMRVLVYDPYVPASKAAALMSTSGPLMPEKRVQEQTFNQSAFGAVAGPWAANASPEEVTMAPLATDRSIGKGNGGGVKDLDVTDLDQQRRNLTPVLQRRERSISGPSSSSADVGST
jgi:hypothetical protein